MLKILGRVSSINVRKVLWTVEALGVAYEREDWGRGFASAQSPQFLKLNPNGQIPVIIDDGFVLWESNAIMTYLCERAGDTDLNPKGLQERGLSAQWLAWQATELNPAWGYAHQALLRKGPGYTDPARIAKSVADWNGKMQILDGQLEKTGAFVSGDAFTLADIAMGLSVHRWMSTPFEKPQLADVQRYYEVLRGMELGAKYMSAATP
jgi:glutathione S-transferase